MGLKDSVSSSGRLSLPIKCRHLLDTPIEILDNPSTAPPLAKGLPPKERRDENGWARTRLLKIDPFELEVKGEEETSKSPCTLRFGLS